jgi:hypothetical protein
MLVNGKEYVEHGIEKYEQQIREREKILLNKLAEKLNASVTFD